MRRAKVCVNTVSNPSTTAPAVVSNSPGSVGSVPLNTVIDVGYSEPLNPATVNTTDVILNGPGGPVALTVSLDATQTVIQTTQREFQAVLQNALDAFLILDDQGVCRESQPRCAETFQDKSRGTDRPTHRPFLQGFKRLGRRLGTAS